MLWSFKFKAFPCWLQDQWGRSISRHWLGCCPGIVSWASYQIRKIAGCACAGNAGNVFPRRRFQRKLLVSDPGMHHGTCVTHVPWCMSGSLTCGDGENVPGIPGACAPAILRIWQEAHVVKSLQLIIPPLNDVEAGYTGFTLPICGQNRVHSVSSTILARSISYLHILWSNFRRCVVCKFFFSKFKNLKFWQML